LRTTITYSPDQDRAALLVARNLATRPEFEPVTGSGQLTLHVGTDWTGVTLVPLPEADFAGAIPSAAAAPTTAQAGTGTAAEAPAPTGAGIVGADPAGGLCDPDR
jgi:hypothetical protein